MLDIQKCLDWYPINAALSSRVVMENLLTRLQSVILDGVPGDVIEMGCHAGDTSVFFARMIQELNGFGPEHTPTSIRRLHLYDSFQGLPEKGAKDNPDWGDAGSVRTAEQVVRARFDKEDLPPPQIHSGWFAELPDAEFPDKIAFAFFDGDLYQSIFDSFVRVYPRLSSGAIVCVHDYGVDNWPGVQRACEEYLADKPERMESACFLLGAMAKK